MTDPTQNDRVTLAVLKNDLAHLTEAMSERIANVMVSIELMRGDMQAFILETRKYRDNAETAAHDRELRIDRLENRMRTVFWIFLAVWGILAAVIASWLKSALGI